MILDLGAASAPTSATPAACTERSEPRWTTTIAAGGPPGIATSSSTAWSRVSSRSSSSVAVVSLHAATIAVSRPTTVGATDNWRGTRMLPIITAAAATDMAWRGACPWRAGWYRPFMGRDGGPTILDSPDAS